MAAAARSPDAKVAVASPSGSPLSSSRTSEMLQLPTEASIVFSTSFDASPTPEMCTHGCSVSAAVNAAVPSASRPRLEPPRGSSPRSVWRKDDPSRPTPPSRAASPACCAQEKSVSQHANAIKRKATCAHTSVLFCASRIIAATSGLFGRSPGLVDHASAIVLVGWWWWSAWAARVERLVRVRADAVDLASRDLIAYYLPRLATAYLLS